jgi:subtilase family serine protease
MAVLSVQQAVAAALTQGAQAAAATDLVEFDAYLPLRNEEQLETLLSELHDPSSAKYQQWLEPSDFLKQFGPTEADLSKVQAALTAHGFTVTAVNAHGMHVQASAGAVASTFGVALSKRTAAGKTRFMAKDTLQIPSELAAANVRIVGLEAVPERHVHSVVAPKSIGGPIIENRYSVTGSYWFDDLKQAYDYPAYYSYKTDGSGVNVAVLMSDLLFPGDLSAYFDHENFSTLAKRPDPQVTTVLVDGGGEENGPGTAEASLDTQQILGGAPGANVTLVSVPDLSDAHLLDGYAYIVDTNRYDIVNSSFGGCELEYTAAFNDGTDYTYILKQYHELFAQGNAEGITFVASSGDEGALPCPSANYAPGVNAVFIAGVSAPADDPDVTAVGGGNLVTTSMTGSLSSVYVRESAFADPEYPYDVFGIGATVSGGYWGAGGGVSQIFAKPAYQYQTNTGSYSHRTLPDVGMQVGGLGYSGLNEGPGQFCDPSAISCSPDDSSVLLAYGVNYGGGFYFTIGTSVSSPEFVGAVALYEQKLGRYHRQGNLNYFLYSAGNKQAEAGGRYAPPQLQYFHRGQQGFDGLYKSNYPSYDYNYIYGNGSPDVRKLFGLTYDPPAGQPQTPGNP